MFQVDGTTSAEKYEYLALAINVFIISYFINSFNMFFNIKLVQFISTNFIIVPLHILTISNSITIFKVKHLKRKKLLHQEHNFLINCSKTKYNTLKSFWGCFTINLKHRMYIQANRPKLRSSCHLLV